MSRHEWQVFFHGLVRQGVKRVRLRRDLFSNVFELLGGTVFIAGCPSKDRPVVTYCGWPDGDLVIEPRPWRT